MEKQQTYTHQGAKERVKIDEPQRFRVVLHNDDFTTMDFVVMILRTVFFKSEAEAERLMLEVHRKGHAVAGIYSRDIATSKIQKATRMARENNFPLRLTLEPDSQR